MIFKNSNINPVNNKTCDCVVRAIAGATYHSWDFVFDELVTLSKIMYSMPNAKDVYTQYLKDYETIPVMHIKRGVKKRYTVKDVCKFKGTFIVQIANHLTFVRNGVCYDTYNCIDRSSYKIWKVK